MRHYLELLRHYRYLILAIVAGTTLVAVAGSVLLLVALPTYTASATVTILPTNTELVFSKTATSSDPMTTLLQTDMEYLRSRSVAERAVAKIRAAHVGSYAVEDGFGAALRDGIRLVLTNLRLVYNLLNSGMNVPPDPDAEAIERLRNSIELNNVEGSFILLIEASAPVPEAAAIASNVLAQAYVERVRDDVTQAAGTLSDYLGREIATREAHLADLDARELDLRQVLGILDPTTERRWMAEAQEAERSKLEDDEVELAGLAARLKTLVAQEEELRRVGLSSQVSQEIAMSRARHDELKERLKTRADVVRRLEGQMGNLASQEKALLALEREREQIQSEVEDLKNRLVTVELSKWSSISELRVIDLATPPSYPSSPQVLINAAVALAAGLLIALFVVVAQDTLSETVKTSVDLQRIAGERALGSIAPEIGARILRGAPPASARALRVFAAGAVPRLAALGDLRASSVAVTGFGEASAIGGAAAGVGAAIASEGHSVRLVTPAGAASPDARTPVGAGELLMGDAKEREGDAPPFVVRLCGPIGAGFQWDALALEGPLLICVVPAGVVTEGMLAALGSQAARHGLANLFFVLATTEGRSAGALGGDRKRRRLIRAGSWLAGFATLGGLAVLLGTLGGPVGWAAGLGAWAVFLAVADRWMRGDRGLPILTYHSVSRHSEWLPWAAEISVSPDSFERHLRAIRSMGLRSLRCGDLVDVLGGGAAVAREGAVSVHLDDGYLDNWVAAVPLLKRHGIAATLFVSLDFIEPGDTPRPNLEDVWAGRCGPEDLQWDGYLNWAELREIQATGLIDVCAHGIDHGRVETGPEVVDEVRPDNWRRLAWVQWRAMPGNKSGWYRSTEPPAVPYGTPVRRNEPALATRAWTPEGLEGEAAYEARVRDALKRPRDAIRRELGAQPDVFSWPQNAASERARELALEIGYRATTGGNGQNLPDESPTRLSRLHASDRSLGGRLPALDRLALRAEVRLFQGNYYWALLVLPLNLARKLGVRRRRRR